MEYIIQVEAIRTTNASYKIKAKNVEEAKQIAENHFMTDNESCEISHYTELDKIKSFDENQEY